MRTYLKAALGLFVGATLCLTPQAAAQPGAVGQSATGSVTAEARPLAAADPAYRILVFSKTAGFRHSSIEKGIETLRGLGTANNFTVDATEDAGTFTTGNLAQYKSVVFLRRRATC